MYRADLQAKYSGMSDKRCETCNQLVTNASLSWSMEHYQKPLCRTCQSLEKYAEEVDSENRGVPSLSENHE
jgi:hypothetical protein